MPRAWTPTARRCCPSPRNWPATTARAACCARRCRAGAARRRSPRPIPLTGLTAADLRAHQPGARRGRGQRAGAGAAGDARFGATRPACACRSRCSPASGACMRAPTTAALHDHVEVGAIPALLRAAAARGRRGAARRRCRPAAARGLQNAPTLLVELADQRQRWQPGQPAHVVNLTLLPMSPEDIGLLDHQLGTGRVLILSRGYGNCRITNTLRAEHLARRLLQLAGRGDPQHGRGRRPARGGLRRARGPGRLAPSAWPRCCSGCARRT